MPSPTDRLDLDLDSVLPAARKILREFLECMTKWDEINSNGTEILRLLAADRDVRNQLDTMYSYYDALLSVFELVPVIGVLDEPKDSGSLSEGTPIHRDNARPDILSQLGPSARRIVESVQEYLDIYDQEYLLKETIQSIVTPTPITNSATPSRFYTAQHVLGFLALWDVQPYLDVETMERIQERLDEELGGKGQC